MIGVALLMNAYLASIFWLCSNGIAGFLGSLCTCSWLKSSYGCFQDENGVHSVIFFTSLGTVLSVTLGAIILGKYNKSRL